MRISTYLHKSASTTACLRARLSFDPAVFRRAVISTLALAAAAYAQPGLPAAFQKVGIDQKLNAQMPLETILMDENGGKVRLGQYFKDKPVVLALVYYECPMLCNMVLNGTISAMQGMSLEPGKDYELVVVSFDDRETPPLAKAKKDNYVRKYIEANRPDPSNGMHFLTGNAVAVRKVAEAVGFHYAWDSMTNQFAHASGIMVLTPQGKVSKYFYGIKYEPRDVRLGLVDASNQKIGSPVDKILLYCYHYDPATGKYGVVVMNIMRIGAATTVFTLGLFMMIWIKREKKGNYAK